MSDAGPVDEGKPLSDTHPPRDLEEPPSADELLEGHDESNDTAERASLIRELFSEVAKRCEGRGIEIELAEATEPGDDLPVLRMLFSAGRERRKFNVLSARHAERLLDTSFEKCRFISGYEAIWSSELHFIEAGISARPTSLAFDRLANALGQQNDDGSSPHRIDLLQLSNGIAVSLGKPSKEYSVLTRSPMTAWTLRLEGGQYSTHDTAKGALELFANSLFFHIDLTLDLAISLLPERESGTQRRRSRPLASISLSEPKFVYNQEAMSLYWYARTAVRFPLLQCLAYYQILELYFPAYSHAEVQRSVRNLVKDPRFDSENGTDISRIIELVAGGTVKRGFGDEKSQLAVAVKACMTDQDLRDFADENEDRKAFLSTKAGSKLSKYRISLDKADADITGEVAARIYDIRCRVVHSKEAGGDQGVLLPGSSEARSLRHDLDLLEFVARKFIIAGSRSVKIG